MVEVHYIRWILNPAVYACGILGYSDERFSPLTTLTILLATVCGTWVPQLTRCVSLSWGAESFAGHRASSAGVGVAAADHVRFRTGGAGR